MASKKKQPTDLTTRLLIQIRDAVRHTNSRLDETNQRVAELSLRVARHEQRALRLATQLTELARSVGELRAAFIDMRQDHRRMDALEERLLQVERKVG